MICPYPEIHEVICPRLHIVHLAVQIITGTNSNSRPTREKWCKYVEHLKTSSRLFFPNNRLRHPLFSPILPLLDQLKFLS
jgi:hypothetical protein